MKYLLILLLIPSLAFSQAKIVYTWKEEPLTVMGQTPGEALSLPICSRDLNYSETCVNQVIKTEDRAVYQIKNPARLGLPYLAQIYTRRDRVSHVTLTTGAENQVSFYRLLVQRYGFPHQQHIVGQAGSAYQKHLVWIGKESKMRFVESLSYESTPQSTLVWTTGREEFDVKLYNNNPKRPLKPPPIEAPRVITGPGF